MKTSSSDRTTAPFLFLAAVLIPISLALSYLAEDVARLSHETAALVGGTWLMFLYFNITAGSRHSDEPSDRAE